MINEKIPYDSLRVIIYGDRDNPNGENLGILSKEDALAEAVKRDLDLVLIVEKSNPPVAKIIDYGQYKYIKNKTEKLIKKNQKQIEIKEIRLSLNISKHDLEIKAKRAIGFLQKKQKVKLTLKLRGKQVNNIAIAEEKIKNFIDVVKDYSIVEKNNKLEKFFDVLLKPIE